MTSRGRSMATVTTCGAALLVLLLFAPALYQPFLAPKFAALELTASLGLVCFALRWAEAGSATRPQWTRDLAFGALFVLGTTLVAWLAAAGRPWGAPYAADSVGRWGSLFGLACGASALDDSPDAQQTVLEAVTIASGAVAALGLLQHLEALPLSIPIISLPGSTFGNRNPAAEVMAMAFPFGIGAAAGTRQRGVRGMIFVALGLELLFLAVTRTRGAWLGAACGLATTMAVARVRISRASGAIAAAAVIVAGVAAWVPGRFNAHDAGDAKRYSGLVEVLQEGVDIHSTALRTRLGLWRRTAAIVRDYPIFGVGPGNWPVVFPLYAEPGATRDGVLSATLAPRQAHDDLLERAAETGLLGLLALGCLVGGASIAVRRRLLDGSEDTRRVTATGAGALVALLALSIGSFPMESPGTLALAGVALGLVAAERKSRNAESSSASRSAPGASRPVAYAALAFAVALVPWVALRAERNLRASRWLGVAERAMRRDRGSVGAAEALSALQHAVAAAPRDYRANLRAAQMFSRVGRFEDSASAARMALLTEPYAPNAWAALAAADLAIGNRDAATRAATRALVLLRDYPFALDVHARSADQQGDVQAATSDRQRLIALAAGPPDDDTARAARALTAAPPADGTK